MLRKPEWHVIICLAVGFYYWWTAYNLEKELAQVHQQHAEYLQAVATANDKATRELVAEINRIDTEKSQEAARAKREADNLRDCITNGRCRVFVPTAGTRDVPTATPAPSMGDGACRTELSPRTATALVDLADRADQLVYKLSACQAYIETVTR